MQPAQGFHGGTFTRALAFSEAHAACVQHKGVQQMQVAPAGRSGALAEVILFAIALAEVLGVEQADGVQAVAADVHAKAHAGRHIHHLAGIGARTQCVDGGRIHAGRQVVALAKARVAADGGVVGKRRDGGDACIAVGGLADAVQPVIGDHGVAVEQQHVMGGVQRHAPVDGTDEAEVLLVLQQGDAGLLCRLLAQPGRDFGLRAGIVDDHELPVRAAGAGQNGFDAVARVIQAAVHWHDHIDGLLGHRLGYGGMEDRGRHGRAAQQAVNAHLGVDEGARGPEDGGVLYVAQVLFQPCEVPLYAGGFLLPDGALLAL